MFKYLIGSVLAVGLSLGPLAAQSSDSVRAAQEALKAKGLDPGPADGVYGPKTREAVKAYQKQQNLNVDGQLGAQTLDSLGVKEASAKTQYKSAGTKVKNSYAEGGKDIGQGSKEMGHDIKHGDVVEAGKDFGKGVGKGAAKMGKGTGHAAVEAAKGTKNAVTPDKDKDK
jgi:peptidoglycan hydrolase-like protein with peptidoglycan-binding domain